MVFGILLATGLFYLVFADGKIQPWNDPSRKSNIDNGEKVDVSREAKESFVRNF